MKRSVEKVTENSNKRQKFLVSRQELGIIESVCLRNFMCHDHLKFDFDPHINFIIGQNGSGKSAVLTGIILALGGKSCTTGRYSNIKGFIKTGKQKAFVSVTLKNGGPFAYQPTIYGEKIVVEREITIDGSSSYKLKSESGKIVSTLKEELNNILIAMDIQIENPVLVLTQETSRNFLMSKHGKEEKLYEFFYKGTGLQSIEEGYQTAKIQREETERDLTLKKQAHPEMEKDIAKLKKLIDSASKVSDLRSELLWASLREMEEKVEEAVKACEKEKKALATFQAESDKCKEVYDQHCLALEQHLKERTECNDRMAELRKTSSELITQRDACSDNLRKCQGEYERHKRQERKLKDDLAALEESIRESEIKNQSDFEEKRRKNNEQIHLLESENLNADKKQEMLKKENEKLLIEHKNTQNMIDSINADINSLNYKKNSLLRDLQQLKGAIKDRQLLFGEHTPKILAEINQRRHEFIQVPRGPIGLDLEIKDPRWNGAIEACLKGHLLRSFCCDNAKDSALLTSILSKYYKHHMPSVIISKFLPNVHNISSNKAQSNFSTIFDMLRIKDPVIANCLIDMCTIECIILIEDITTAQEVMLDRTPPANCRSAYLLNRDEILLNPYRHYAASKNIPSPILQSIDQNHIRSLEQDLRSIETEIQNKTRTLKELQTGFQRYPREVKKIENEIVKLMAIKSHNTSIIFDLKQFENPKDVSIMQEEVVNLRIELQKKTEEVQKSEQNLEVQKSEYNQLMKIIQAHKEKLQKEKLKFDNLGKEINECGRNKEIMAISKKEFESAVKNSERELANKESIVTYYKKLYDEALAGAQKTKQIITNRSSDEIRGQLEAAEKVIHEQSKCDRAALFEKYKSKHQQLVKSRDESKRLEHYCKTLESMLKMRAKKLKEIIKHIQHCLDLTFSVVLKGNGFTGRLNFSKPGALRLEATPKQENPESGGKKSCRSLSGGERSFVTISFLLALWDRIKMPFRILDEYDVFMDSNNRHLSINLLIRRADCMKNVQFIFLSPLELPEMRESEKIKIHKMPPPKRIGLTQSAETEETNEEN